MLMNRIGMLIRELREKKFLTQDELARLAGVNSSFIQRWESPGYCGKMRAMNARRIANALNIDVDVLMRLQGCESNIEEFDMICKPEQLVGRKVMILGEILTMDGVITRCAFSETQYIDIPDWISADAFGIRSDTLLRFGERYINANSILILERNKPTNGMIVMITKADVQKLMSYWRSENEYVLTGPDGRPMIGDNDTTVDGVVVMMYCKM